MNHQKAVQSTGAFTRSLKLTFPMLVILAVCSCKNNKNASAPEPKPDIVIKDSLPKVSTNEKTDVQEANDYKGRLHNIVERMNGNLGRISLTGNPERDFAWLMTTNLFSGIEICLLHKQTGVEPSLKQMAQQKQVYLQKQEDYFDNYQFSSSAQFPSNGTKKAPRLKHLTIPKDAKKDVVFAAVVSEYNQNTIDLAKEYLGTGTNGEMKRVAQNLVQNFTNELQQLKRFLNKHEK